MNQPIITADVLELIRKICCQEVGSSDTADSARWKNAQRQVYVKLRSIHIQQCSNDKTFAQGVSTRVPDFTD